MSVLIAVHANLNALIMQYMMQEPHGGSRMALHLME